MLARLKTFTLLGIEAMPVDVEVDISPAAMPKTTLVGLPDAEPTRSRIDSSGRGKAPSFV